MIEPFRFSPSRLAISYVALSVVVLALFAIALWYAWSVNLTTFKEYVHAEDVDRMVGLFQREGAPRLAKTIESQVGNNPGDQVIVLADASKSRIAGNLPTWPAAVPDLPGTYGLVIRMPDSSMRVVASHVALPGGYHLLLGRESARFQSLVDYFWFGVAAATAIVVVFGTVLGRLVRRTEEALHRTQQDLERLVMQRTEELQQTNKSLRQSEAYLRAAKARFEGMVEIAEDAIISVDSRQHIVLFNRGAEKVFGYSQEEIIGRSLDLLVPQRFVDAHRVHLESFGRSPDIARAMGQRREVFGFRKDGREFPAEASISKLDLGSDLVFTVILRDISERRQAEEALRRQTTYLDELFELAPDAVVLTTIKTPRILRINREFTRIFGYTSEEAVGNSLRNLVMPDGLELILPEDPDLRAGRKVEKEVIRRRKDGTRFHAHISGKRIQLSDDDDTACLIFRDISARKQAEALFAGEKRLLEIIATGAPLPTTLDALCRLAEDIDGSSLTSILLVDSKVEHVSPGAGPSLPVSYMAALDGRPVGPGFGPCGLAVHLGEQVISADIAADERWADEYRALALAHGLPACWSTPIKSSQGRILGTFAVYPSEPASPTAEQRSRIEQLSHLASIAIERAQAIDALRRSEERYARAMDAAGDGHIEWIVATDEFYASPRFLEMCGFPVDTTFMNWADFLARFPFHPEDRDRVIDAINTTHASTNDRLELEMRILRHRETRWDHLTGLCSRDETGKLLRWNAAITDITERKLADEALRQSQEGYALAMEASGEGHWDWNIEKNEYHVSPRLLELARFPRGATFKDRDDFIAQLPFHPEDRPRWEDAVAAHFAGKTSRFDIEIRMIPRGETQWIHMTGILSRDASGKPVRWTGSVADITERRCAEDALRLSEQRYALAMDATGDGHWDWDIPNDKIYVSPLLLEMCGVPTDTTFASRSEWFDRFPFYPGEAARYAQAVADHFAGKTARLDIDIRINPRGETRWVHLTGRCSRDALGRPVRWAGSVTDITARKRVAEELRTRQDMLDLAQKVAHVVAFEWRVGAEGQNRWSPDLEAMYGIPPGSYDGTYESWKELVYPDDWPNVREAIKMAQQTGDVAAEYRVVHPDGAIRWLQAKGRMFFDPDGKPTRVVGFMLDVTDRHLAQEELQRMERALRQAQRLEAMGTLAGGIAHDFNNLLGAILGYGEMALRDVPPGSRLRRDVESIMIAGERGRALVDRILAFSRSGVGERVAVHVEEVVRETLALFTAKLPRGIAVEQQMDAVGAAVMGDPTQIHQVLMNLLINAAHAMAAGGNLRVSLSHVCVRVPRAATAGTIAARDYVILDVADTGTGIAPEVIDKIFDPFFTTKEVGVGSGLGLSLVHGIVTGLSGAIDVESTVGKGSVFKVYLPYAGDVATLIKRRKRLAPRTRRGTLQRIMVVDDEASLVRLATETLTRLGYAAAGFASGPVALDEFLANPEAFDAVITDESMPGISGSELIRKMREIRPTIPILLVSGYLSASVIERARQAGASEVLKKPLSARQLASAIDRALHPGRTDDDFALPALPKTETKQRRGAAASTSRSRAARR